MSELRALLDTRRRLRQTGQPALLVTLVSVRGSSYRRPGARLLLAAPGGGPDAAAVATGSVSGGCLERDLAQRGWWRLGASAAALVSYDLRDDDDELGARLGLGCGGGVDLLLERHVPDAPGDPLAFIADCVAAQQVAVMVTVFRSSVAGVAAGDRLAVRAGGDGWGTPALRASPLGAVMTTAARRALIERSPTQAMDFAGGAVHALVEVIQPPPHLFLFGSGRDAVPVAALGRTLGWTISVFAPRPRFDLTARFVGVADHLHSGEAATVAAAVNAAACPLAVVMSHNLDDDRAALAMLLPSAARYIGVLGPARRTRGLLAEIELPDVPPRAQRLERLYAPTGLAIGAETPDEIALAIISEAQAVVAGAAACHLRDQPSIHGEMSVAAGDVAPIVARR